MVSNISNLTKGNQTFYDIVAFTNEVTEGMIGMMFIIIIFIILLAAFLRRYSFPESMMVSSFICLILSILLDMASLLNPSFIIIFALIMASSAFAVKMANR